MCVLKDQVCKPSNTDFKKGCGARLCCSCQDVSFLGVKGRSWQGLGGTKWSETIPVTRVSQDGQWEGWQLEGCSALRGLFLGSPGYSFCSAHLGQVVSCHWSHIFSRAQLWYKCVTEVCWKTCRKVSPDHFKKKLLHPACSIAATPKSLFPPITKRSCELTPENSWLEMFGDGSGGSHL